MDRDTPLVTVLMPHRNAHVGFFHEAVESVFAQSTARWKLLVIDDASSDPAARAALDWLAQLGDERVQVVESRSRYVTGALNTGLKRAETDYVCVLHCDDLLAPHAVETLGRFIDEHPSVDYFYSSRMFIDEAGCPLSRIYEAEPFSSVAAFERSCPVKHLHCFRVRAALAIGGMDETLGLHGADDYDFPWSMAEAGCTFKAIPDCLYSIRDHRAHYRLTTHVPLDVQTAELERILRKHGMREHRVQEEIEQRTRAYLRQALYSSEEDRQAKEGRGFDPRTGWRIAYRAPRRTEASRPPGRDRLWPFASASRRVILRTGQGRLRPGWARVYSLFIRVGAAYLRRGSPEASVYVQGSFAAGEPIFGISDIDLVLVHSTARASARRADGIERWTRLCRRIPWLPRLVYATAYEEPELAEAASATVLTYGLDAVGEGESAADRALFFGDRAGRSKLSLRLRPGLYGPVRDWRLVAGPDRRPPRVARDRQAELVAAWLELQHWWQYALHACARPTTLRAPYLAYLCVKLIAEPVRIWLWVAQGEQVTSRRQALERGLELLPEEEDALRFALALHGTLSRDPSPPLADALPAFVRLSARLARLLDAEMQALPSMEVILTGDVRDLIVLSEDLAEARALYPPGTEPRLLPLVDWRARVFPASAGEVLALVPGDPGDRGLLAAMAKAGRPGFAPALRAQGILVLPAAGGSERPLSRAALRGIQFAGSDPVTFALEAGEQGASFPGVRGWSAVDSARRAVAEHRAWLESDAGAADPLGRRLERLFTAARAGLFRESVAAGQPMLPVTVTAVVEALRDRQPVSALLDDALDAYRRSCVEGMPPPLRTVSALGELVRSLGPYRTPDRDAVRQARRDPTTASSTAS